MRNVAELLKAATETLASAGIEEPLREAMLLTAHGLGRETVFLYAHPEQELAETEYTAVLELVDRRARREPFHYITGEKEFFGLVFAVRPGILIPRPETEIVVEEGIKRLRDAPESTFLDIGAGSGCIAISLLTSLPQATGTAVDISPVALEVAAENAVRHGVEKRLTLTTSDLFENISQKFDLIVTNPPYVPAVDADGMQREVVEFEPHSALFSGPDGLDAVRRIVEQAPDHLVAAGTLIMEIGDGQADAVSALFDESIWSSVRFIEDLRGIRRTVVATLQA